MIQLPKDCFCSDLKVFSASWKSPKSPIKKKWYIFYRFFAHELVDSVRRNTSIDWQLKESVQAKMRTLIKRILRKYKYPPDDPATGEYTTSVNKVLSQAELLADFWSGH